MELYLPRRKKELIDCLETFKYARLTARRTGKFVLYHWIDSIFCYLRYGCSPLQYFEGGFYKLRSFDREEAYTKRRIGRVRAKFNDRKYEYLLGCKTEFNKHFAVFVKRDWIDCKTASATDIEDFVRRKGHCIIKPICSSKGKGIKVINKEDAKALSLSYAGKDCILEEIIKQHPMLCFGNKSVNTLRMMTIMDASGEVHLLKVGLRCGTGDSVIDNFCAGGVIYPIDFQYGRISGPGLTNFLGEYVYVHPGTDIYMLGREVPFWQQAIEFVERAAKRIPQVRFVGWDVAITSEGPVLIEGNQHPGVIFDPQNIGHGLYREMMSYK